MKRRFFLAALGALTAATVTASLPLAGCSETSGDVDPTLDASGQSDAPAVSEDGAPSEDAASDALPADAGPDATDADAGPRCTTDDWCHTDLPTDAGTLSLTDVWADRNEAWAVSREGLVLHWQSGAWSVVWKADVALTAVQRAHDGAVWIVGKAGSIFRHNAGTPLGEWTPIPSGTGMDLVAVCEGSTSAATPQNLWIAGQQTILLHWTGGGNPSPAWSFAALGPIENRGIRCAGDGVWAVGLDLTNYGTALYQIKSDTEWTQKRDLPTTQFGRPFSSVWASSESDIWMVNIHKIVHGPGADAPSWTTYDVGDWYFGSPMDWDIWGSAPNDLWIVGRHGRIYHFDGTALKLSITSMDGVILPNSLHGISGESANDLWVVGDDVALHRKTQN